MTRCSWPCAMIALLVLAAPSAQAQEILDSIHQIGDSTVQGEIVKETFKEVVYSLGQGVKSAVANEKIKPGGVEYADKPSRFDEALAKTRANDPGAIELWEKVMKECDSKQARMIFKQHAYYHAAESASAQGNSAKAVELLNGMLTEFPESMYFIEGFNMMADNFLANGKPDQAIDTAKKAAAKAKDAGMPEAKLYELDLIKGRALEAMKKFDEAKNEYKNLAGKASRTPNLAFRAKLGVARCCLAVANFTEAESLLNEISEKAEDQTVLAGAYNGLGDCNKIKAEKEANVDHLRKALMSYMRGVVQYLPAKGGDPFEHARALYGAAACFEKLKDTQPTPEGKGRYFNFAHRLYQECRDTYPGTKLGDEAANRLKKIE